MIRRKKDNVENPNRDRNSDSSINRAQTYNYHSVRSTNETNTGRTNREVQTELSDKTEINWIRHLPGYLIVLAIIVLLIYALTLSTTPKVEIIDVSNQTIVQPASVYQQAAQNIFKSSFQNKNKLTINTDQVASEIESKYPEINAVTIIIPLLGHQPIVEIRPAQSILILSNSEGQYVINQQGNAVLQLSSTSASKYNLPVVTDETGFKVQIGQEAISDTSVKFIKTVVDQFTAKSLVIQSMKLSTTPYELDVQVRGLPYYIKFNLLSDPLYATGTYFATAKLFSPSNPVPTQYVDVRIPGRAYYK